MTTVAAAAHSCAPVSPRPLASLELGEERGEGRARVRVEHEAPRVQHLAGAFSLGVANKLLEPYAGAVLGKILVLVAIILFIQKRPRGLFALRGRAVEA